MLFRSSREPDEPLHCGVAGGSSEWFAYVPAASGTLKITTDGSDYDTVLAVYVASTNDFEDFTLVTCDNNGGLDGRDSRVEFQAAANQVYYIVVDGVDGASGKAMLNYELSQVVRFENTRLDSGLGFLSEVVAPVGRSVVVERSADFKVWTKFTNGAATMGVIPVVDPVGTGPFVYRARLP